jgi:hypothetical protein
MQARCRFALHCARFPTLAPGPAGLPLLEEDFLGEGFFVGDGCRLGGEECRRGAEARSLCFFLGRWSCSRVEEAHPMAQPPRQAKTSAPKKPPEQEDAVNLTASNRPYHTKIYHSPATD